MCDWNDTVRVQIMQTIEVDRCLASTVVRLNELGVATLASCCGHGHDEPEVMIRPSSIHRARALGLTTEFNHGEYFVLVDDRTRDALDLARRDPIRAAG